MIGLYIILFCVCTRYKMFRCAHKMIARPKIGMPRVKYGVTLEYQRSLQLVMLDGARMVYEEQT